ncbi:DUF4105 domain-containing protein [Niabella beijingensis]|uniref:lipoprotein N-acyltransferase Lnb domain-containing protein n=1 Tax=Niabella beijingensis TaxID=2872700 RepID=UPI001CBE9F0C|nr:DUF4105 domain-containing protein [Niabella beijingensis]MBZ4187883.1 DUF4105 domain-containing protein [Niabella beijingensis]
MKKWFSGLLFLLIVPVLYGQQTATAGESRQQISILTCGTGGELYASFGHTAIRIVDSIQGTDEVYNYGTFDFNDPQFYSKFTLGKLLYFLDKEPFYSFLKTYELEGRSVTEQVLYLDDAGKKRIRAFLEQNLLPANRAYRYDFLYDNCATRVRDVFPQTLGASFRFGPALENRQLSFRRVIDSYLADKPWERFGIDIILGSPVDAAMDEHSALFLPDYLYTAFKNARYNGAGFVETRLILPAKKGATAPGPDTPFWILLAVLLLVAAVHFVKGLYRFRKPVDGIVLFVTGLLGLQLLFMWFLTNHHSCAYNWNVLWALPFNTVMAFVIHKHSRFTIGYTVFAAACILAALVIHFSGIQQLPLRELMPLLLALLLIYGKAGTQKRDPVRSRTNVVS